MSEQSNLKAGETGIVADEKYLVGLMVKCLVPEPPTGFAQQIISHALLKNLEKDRIELGSQGYLFGAKFLLWSIELADRKGGTRAFWKTASELGILDVCEIAFWDIGEGYWRTVHPHTAEPFDRFLTQENFAAAKAVIDVDRELINRVLGVLTKLGAQSR